MSVVSTEGQIYLTHIDMIVQWTETQNPSIQQTPSLPCGTVVRDVVMLLKKLIAEGRRPILMTHI